VARSITLLRYYDKGRVTRYSRSAACPASRRPNHHSDLQEIESVLVFSSIGLRYDPQFSTSRESRGYGRFPTLVKKKEGRFHGRSTTANQHDTKTLLCHAEHDKMPTKTASCIRQRNAPTYACTGGIATFGVLITSWRVRHSNWQSTT
jgi:hypothetical protein